MGQRHLILGLPGLTLGRPQAETSTSTNIGANATAGKDAQTKTQNYINTFFLWRNHRD